LNIGVPNIPEAVKGIMDMIIFRSTQKVILAAKTASLLESAIGLRNALGDEAVSQLTTNVVRKDLPGHPLAYQVALRNLIANLLGREDLLIK